ncbi:MAG: hypothetical protein L0287_13000 [Anaerolineae bacterium]|nr:hypothetical protein [Anaerolineae bacterium]
MAEGLESVAIVFMFVIGAATLIILHYGAVGYFRLREKYFGDYVIHERRRLAEGEIATLTLEEKAALRHILIIGRPRDLSDQIWQSLETKTSFMERDFTGPKGIKDEFLSVLPEILERNRGPIILAKLETTVSQIGDFTPALGIQITNTGPPLDDQCLVQIENHDMKTHMPDPFVLRTEGQIRGQRTGRFNLSAQQKKLVPVFYRNPGRINEFRFIGEDGQHYIFAGDSSEFDVGIYGAKVSTKIHIRFSVGTDWKIHAEMEYC